jgi:hypothetical protein
MNSGGQFKTGSFIPENGTYRVIHPAHRLPTEVTLVKGQKFPRCGKCAAAVGFELVQATPDKFVHEPVAIYELPVLDEDELSRPA